MSTTSTIPTVSEGEIRARVGEQSFQRGRQYFRDGAIFDARRQDMTLKARCAGSRGNAYRLHVTFDATGIADADCSCPVGTGGYCKHIAALLLTWRERPEAFGEVAEIDAALEQRSKDELIALVKQMLRLRPDLESLLEMPLPAAGKRHTPASPETYYRQAIAAIRGGADEWGDADSADELLALAEIGDGFVDQEDFASAAAVYEAVSRAALENFELFDQESDDLGNLIHACVEGLGRCLAGEEHDRAAREMILQALFAVYRFDVDYGGIGLGDDVPDLVREHATAEERRMVAGWVREVLPQGTDWSANFHRQVYGGFLLDLEEDVLDDETFLRICRETGRVHDLVDRFLALGRLDEAIAQAERVGDYELLGLADIFVQHGHGEVAERLMRERSEKTQDTRVLDWLKERYKARGDQVAALELARTIFRLRPSLEGYREIRELAAPLDRWEAVRPALRLFLQEARRDDLLIQVYLDEGEIDHALEAVKAKRTPSYGYYGYSMALEVAKAAEETRPRAALDLYQQHAEGLIAQQGRQNYQQACRYLAKVRRL
jgi:uncharacterized Zn finger protein